MKRNLLIVLCLLLVSVSVITACSNNKTALNSDNNGTDVANKNADNEKELANLKVGYIYVNHQTPLMLAASKGKELNEKGVYLKEIIEKQKYILMDGETPISNIELVVTKSGSETMTMTAQGHLDISLASNTAFITSRDQENDVKILCPIHTEGIGLVVDKNSDIENWEDFEKYIGKNNKPVTVGFHSPTSAPLILFEAALTEAGISYTKNPEDLKSDIMLMDLKSTSNLIPALTSKQVEAWVGPSPYPELATTEGVGKIILDMKHLPPEGKWYDFPCCVVGSTEKVLATYPNEVEKFIELLTIAADYSEKNPHIAAEITAEFTGVSIEAAEMSTIKYTTDPSESWMANMKITYDTLKTTNSLSGKLKEKSFEDSKEEIFDLSFINKVLKK